MARRIGRIFVAFVALAGACGVPRLARAADPQEQQLAQALFDEGRSLMEKKRYHEACAKLAESQRLDPGGGTLLNLAICYEKDGKLATAKVAYDDALAAAVNDRRRDRQTIARERLAALESTVPRLRIVVPLSSDMEGLELKLDGMTLRRAAWGVATPVDPGSHAIDVTGPGRTPWSTAVTVEVSQKKIVEVPQLVPLAPLAAVPVLPAVAQPPASPAPPPSEEMLGGLATQTPEAPLEPRKSNPVYYTALGVTLVAGAASAVTGVLALIANNDAKSGCLPDRSYCRDQASIDASGRAHTLAWISTITLGVAAAGFLTTLIVPSKLRRVGVQAAPNVGGGSLGLSGSF